MATTTIKPGLEGVVAAETRLSRVNGEIGELIIVGYPMEELAPAVTAEETIYLLWHGNLPTAAELAEFKQTLSAHRTLPPATLALLQAAAAKTVDAMDALRMAAGSLNLDTANTGTPQRDALTLVGTFPTIMAAYWRLRQGQPPVAPNPQLGHAANYLYMLSGNIPTAERVRGLEIYLNTVCDDVLTASTFTARTIIATQSDLISAITGAVGGLKGPRHGGAPGPAMDMILEIGTIENAEPYLRQKLEHGGRLMGFGHRMYKVRDPRAVVLAQAAEQIYQTGGNMELYNLARGIEEVAQRLLEEYKPGRRLYTNIEFYTALLLHGLGLPTELFTPTFAIGRVAGWVAHCFEEMANGRLMRPDAIYVGPEIRHLPDKPQIAG